MPSVAAARFGLGEIGRVAVFIHTGSRGPGQQVCEDYLRVAMFLEQNAVNLNLLRGILDRQQLAGNLVRAQSIIRGN